jgi:hypothetical protein
MTAQPSPEHVAASALVARAESAVRLSGTDPRLALAGARTVLTEAEAIPEGAEAISVALRAWALAARELGDLALAAERLLEAIAAGAGFPRRVAQARMSLVTIRAQLGDPEGGLRLADLAERDLAGTDLARLDVQRSAALIVLGRHREAVWRCDRALGLLDEDPWFLSGGLLNRGVAHTYLGEYGAAEADLSQCGATARAAGLDHVAMLAEGNLPFVAARRGDIAAAFDRYRAAEAALFGFPERLAAMRTDFAEALVAARLPGEARTLLEQAVPELVAAGAKAAVPAARLLLAQAELLTGDARSARLTAQSALEEFAAQGRQAWTPLAAEVVLRARLAHEPQDLAHEPQDGESLAYLLDRVLACAAELDRHGWAAESSALRLSAARTAVRLDRPAAARTQLDLLTASAWCGATRPVVLHHALALRRRLDGDLDGALAAAAEGTATGHSQRTGPCHQTAPGAPDLRVHAVRPAEDLAAFGLELAIDMGDPWMVLGWTERWRSIVRGRPVRALPGPTVIAGTAGTLVELARKGDELWAITVSSAGCAMRSLGSYAAAAEATVRVRYGLRRRNLRDGDAVHGNRDDGPTYELSALDRMLMGPLDLDEGPVVVVPTGALCTLPWPLLPSLAGRPVSVASDAAAWLAAKSPENPDHAERRTREAEPRVVAVAGPGLRHARAEAEMVAATHHRGERISAHRREVLAALEQADTLHVAAHGMFSPRSPMLSQITLDDGSLMAYDLLRTRRTPRLVVLSACDAGMAHAPVDGVALGLAGAFLDRGTECVVAGVIPIRDDEALALMTLFHAVLADGRSPAEALGAAAVKTGVGGFVCFGDGGTRPGTRS